MDGGAGNLNSLDAGGEFRRGDGERHGVQGRQAIGHGGFQFFPVLKDEANPETLLAGADGVLGPGPGAGVGPIADPADGLDLRDGDGLECAGGQEDG